MTAPGWGGQRFTDWPPRPAPACGTCGAPGHPYPAGARCDTHRPGGPPPTVYPLPRPPAAEGALDRARRRWPAAPACAATDHRGQPACLYPLDPANGDEVMHQSCTAEYRRYVAAMRLVEERRRSEPARAALAARGDAA
jgi:hypothetical protein